MFSLIACHANFTWYLSEFTEKKRSLSLCSYVEFLVYKCTLIQQNKLLFHIQLTLSDPT